jgi:hypothetical protein
MPEERAIASRDRVAIRDDLGSFRDPSGFVYSRDGAILRQINIPYGDRWEELKGSGLLGDLQRRGFLIGHEETNVDLAFAPSIAHSVIRPEPIAFVSYPYEWSFGQLTDAAQLTLEAQSVASAAGYTLRDASAYNVQFHRGGPILIDTLSFERADRGAPWRAYRQFCEHFLAPLALMAHRDVRCGLMLREFIDGIPIDLAATLLPGRTKLDVGMASHLHAHARAQRRAAASAGMDRHRPTPQMGALRQAALIDSLRRTIEKLKWRPVTSWARYIDHTSYSDTAAASKDRLVKQFLHAARGNVVWDLGANVGRFSAIAASLGRTVVAWDADPGATELHYRALREASSTSVLPLLTDLGNPSPGLGWTNTERRSMIDRANADVVLALALVHHLTVGRNIRLSMIAQLFADLAPTLIVEFIPESDAMVQRMLEQRGDRQPYPTIEEFRRILAARYAVADEAVIEGSGRVLLRMIRRD